jgi:hypothetical protein
MSTEPAAPPPPPPPARGNKTLLYVGIAGGCLLLFIVLGAIGGTAAYFLLRKPAAKIPPPGPVVRPAEPGAPADGRPEIASRPAPTPAPPARPVPFQTQIFVNAREGLEKSLASHYIDCLFAYPAGWKMEEGVRKNGHGFMRVSRSATGGNGMTESFSIGAWSRDPKRRDQEVMQTMAQKLGAAFTKAMGEYKQISYGPTRSGLYEGMELKFSGRSNEGAPLWGRIIFLSRQTQGQQEAPMLTLLASGTSGAIRSADDVGVKGEMPVILNTLRWGGDVARAGQTFRKQPNGTAIVFSLLDLTEDGSLTGTELLNAELLRFDENGDRRVTLEEFSAGNPSK